MLPRESFRSFTNTKHLLLLGAAVIMTAEVALAMGKVALKSSQTVERSIPIGVLKRVHIANTGGNVVVSGNPGAGAITIFAVKSVWARTPGKGRAALAVLDIAIEPRGDLLEVHPAYPQNWNKTFEVVFFVTVPSSFRVEVASPSGAIQVRNVREVDINGGDGDVLLSQVRTVTAKTTTGSVEIEPTTGPIDVTTGSGLVRAKLQGQVRSVRVLTTSGDVMLQLPANIGASLGVTTTSGMVMAHGLTLRDANQTRFGLTATVNNGGIPIEVTSTRGAVTVSAQDIGPTRIRAIGTPGQAAAPASAVAPATPPQPAVEETPSEEQAPAPTTEEMPAQPESSSAGPSRADTTEQHLPSGAGGATQGAQ